MVGNKALGWDGFSMAFFPNFLGSDQRRYHGSYEFHEYGMFEKSRFTLLAFEWNL